MRKASRRPPLDREAILDAAIAILDRDGLEALSMRQIGAALGVEAMSLYHHVPSKSALLDGIHERILLSLDPPEPPSRARSWQAFVRHQAHALHRALRAHPHAIPLFATRPASTPAAIERLDHYLVVLANAGFDPLDALSVVQLVAQLVVGHAMWTTGLELPSVGRPIPIPIPIPSPSPSPKEPAANLEAIDLVLARWDPDGELEMGIEALLHGFELRRRSG